MEKTQKSKNRQKKKWKRKNYILNNTCIGVHYRIRNNVSDIMLYRYTHTHTVQPPWQFNGAVRSNKWDKTGFCFCALLFYRRTQNKKKKQYTRNIKCYYSIFFFQLSESFFLYFFLNVRHKFRFGYRIFTIK